ncbi:MAG: hypothetical protein QOK39_387, partial [Acidimicrobiaceae bacterium]|nr:hypothetical protein [Acidimicrobiaceae bacterium]
MARREHPPRGETVGTEGRPPSGTANPAAYLPDR